MPRGIPKTPRTSALSPALFGPVTVPALATSRIILQAVGGADRDETLARAETRANALLVEHPGAALTITPVRAANGGWWDVIIEVRVG